MQLIRMESLKIRDTVWIRLNMNGDIKRMMGVQNACFFVKRVTICDMSSPRYNCTG